MQDACPDACLERKDEETQVLAELLHRGGLSPMTVL